jgi:protein gp37
VNWSLLRDEVSQLSNIEWTDSTWNPVTGCTKVSPGCKNCYAETFAERFRGVPAHPYEQGFDLKLWPERLEMPLRWKEPRTVFVNSMSDLFHEDVPDEFVGRVFNTMIRADHHVFQVLTKRSKRMAQWTRTRFRFRNERLDGRPVLPRHIWLGVSVETERYVHRIRELQEVPAQVRFLSLEPLLGPMDLRPALLRGIHWVIVGGESGHKARPMDPGWVRPIQDQCARVGVHFFFKQWGAFNCEGQRVGKKRAGRILHGRTYDDMPALT